MPMKPTTFVVQKERVNRVLKTAPFGGKFFGWFLSKRWDRIVQDAGAVCEAVPVLVALIDWLISLRWTRTKVDKWLTEVRQVLVEVDAVCQLVKGGGS